MRSRRRARHTLSSPSERMQEMRILGGKTHTAGADPRHMCPLRLHTVLLVPTHLLRESAGHAQVVCHAEPVAPAIWKQVVRLLSSPGFHARAALLPAVARLAPWPASGASDPNPDPVSGLHVLGMVARAGPEGAAPYLPGLMGAGPGVDAAGGEGESAGGLLGALAAGEWATRRAAADCLRALCVALGPQLDRAQVWRANASDAQVIWRQEVACHARKTLSRLPAWQSCMQP